MMIHVSDILHNLKCSRYCWNCQNKKLPYDGFYHMDFPFYHLWIQYYNFEDYGMGNVGDSNETTLKLLEEHSVVLHARFTYHECRTRVPILIKIENGFKAIYPHLSAFPKENNALTIKMNQQICEAVGVQIIENEILYINKDYIRGKDFDVHEFLKSSNQLFNKRNHLGKTIKQCMDELDYNLETYIEETKKVLENDEPILKRSKLCTNSRRCVYYDTCFDDNQLDDNSILFLTTSRHKLEAFESGIEHIHEMDSKLLDGFHLQYSQYLASKNQYFVDRIALKEWLSRIQYPISYLDFEWDTFAVPPYEKMKPFDVLCFQYSLHVENNGELIHKDFFDVEDCREKFICSILENVPKEGSILVYNMEGAEKLRLIQLGEQFPQYAEDLKQIYDRMIDLSKPFEMGIYYHNKMRGHYSLKSVLPVFTDEYSYQDLNVRNGLNAVHVYRTFNKANEEDKDRIREELREYCKMDTFAEYIVYHGLMNCIKEKENA